MSWQRDIAERLRSVPWRRAVPERYSWLLLLCSPTSYVLVVALALTVLAKMSVLSELEGAGWWPALLVWAITGDCVLHLGLAAIFSAGESRRRWLLAITAPLALLALVFAVLNAGYLSETGEQLSARRIADGIDRFADFERAAADFLRRTGWLKLGAITGVLAALPFALRVSIRRRRGAWDAGAHGRERAKCAAWVGGVAALLWLVWPDPGSIAVRQLGYSAALDTYVGWVRGGADHEGAGNVTFTGYEPPTLVRSTDIAAFARRAGRPNVVLVIGESTRRDHTSLVDGSLASTPHLRALAARGTEVTTTRAALPHTTKSVFSMMCGRLPLMQRVTVEVSAALSIQCLPDVLGRAGYRSAFFQSALGTFEQRPRLVDKLGYDHFEAWEEIGGEPLGYLASDDQSLAPAFARWLDEAPQRPFFATLLTSAAHHPYRLPAALAASARARGAATGSSAERYARLVEGQDALLGEVIELLKERDRLHDTIVVFAGDHGEGFGAHGVRQHDSNFYEEGLRVPWVMAGPGVPRRSIAGNASLVDMAPTLLHLLGLPVAPDARLEGVNVFGGLPDRPRWFGCWFELSCRGFVLGDRKVVYMPGRDQLFFFDLARDPQERAARALPADLERIVPQLHRVIEAHQTTSFPLVAGELRKRYGAWRCPRDQACTHPKSPKGVFFEKP